METIVRKNRRGATIIDFKQAPSATVKKHEYILNLLSQYVTPGHIIVMDDEARRGEYRTNPKLQSGDRVTGARSDRCR